MSSKSIYKDIHFYSTELTRKINIVDLNFLQLYINIINMSSMIVDYPNNVYTENHHILPKSVFPEYKDCSWNIIKLTAYNHLMAHYYLHKAFNNAKFTHAFAQMKRVISNFEGKDLEDIAKLYEEERVRIREAISESQTLYWKNLSDDELISKKKATSNFFKNKLVVKDKDGVIYHLDKSDPRILSGELVYHLTGTTKFLYVVENEYIGKYISTSLNRFAKIIESDYCVLKELESNKDKIISPRCKSKLIKQFKGKSYYDIGIKIVPLESQSIMELENIYAEFTWG